MTLGLLLLGFSAATPFSNNPNPILDRSNPGGLGIPAPIAVSAQTQRLAVDAKTFTHYI